MCDLVQEEAMFSLAQDQMGGHLQVAPTNTCSSGDHTVAGLGDSFTCGDRAQT